jgi:hypothetical protein
MALKDRKEKRNEHIRIFNIRATFVRWILVKTQLKEILMRNRSIPELNVCKIVITEKNKGFIVPFFKTYCSKFNRATVN